MTQSYEQAASHIAALTGSVDTLMHFRCIHETDKGVPAHTYVGSISQLWEKLCGYNNAGWGIFFNVQVMDGQGYYLHNVQHIRAHIVDLDNTLTSHSSYQRAVSSNPLPSFAVQTSPDKFHIYWIVQPYQGNDFYTLQQRRLVQLYDGDSKVIDAARVLRLAGFLHQKNPSTPHLVHCWQLGGFGQYTPVTALASTLEHINVIESETSRHNLGEPSMAAPSLDWLAFAMSLVNPNDMDRTEWLSFTAAIKQAGWSLTDEQTLFDMWSKWCSQYDQGNGNDLAENQKQWNSIRETKVGWTSIKRKTSVDAYIQFGHKTPPTISPPVQQAITTEEPVNETLLVHGPDQNAFPEILSDRECREWFKHCYFVSRTGEIFSPSGRFMNSTKFNGKYGGKHFVITTTGKTTDEAWKAALRSTCWTIPKVDHVRFLPDKPPFAITEDEIGRKGINSYIQPNIKSKQGDVSLWLKHVEKILPVQSDREILYSYLAHCAKYPGHKIPWAPMIQSAEGVGKTVFREVMAHALGGMYVYSPKAPELVKSGSTFNAWQRGKLLIVVDEIKIDERRELIEILKPMITDSRIEIQSKGVDQDMEDNPANWLFFSNYKDAIPINQNGRRYSIFYSAIQSKEDLINAGMDDEYFNKLWTWLRDEDGLAAVTYWLLNYPVKKMSENGLPKRAPETSSHAEALRITRTPGEVIITDAINDGIIGFRGGFVSSLAALRMLKASGMKSANARTVQTVLENMRYIELGKSDKIYPQEDVYSKTTVYANASNLRIENYGITQGYGF